MYCHAIIFGQCAIDHQHVILHSPTTYCGHLRDNGGFWTRWRDLWRDGSILGGYLAGGGGGRVHGMVARVRL